VLTGLFGLGSQGFPGQPRVSELVSAISHCASVQISQNWILGTGIRMRTFTSADAKNNFGELIDMARAGPVAITK